MTEERVVFRAGEDGYHTYRIPALPTLPGGRTLAFCEGRRDSQEDYGKINLVMKVSDDGCATFSGIRVICQNGEDTVGNPCPVYDRDTGRIWMFLNTNLATGPEDPSLFCRFICLFHACRRFPVERCLLTFTRHIPQDGDLTELRQEYHPVLFLLSSA